MKLYPLFIVVLTLAGCADSPSLTEAEQAAANLDKNSDPSSAGSGDGSRLLTDSSADSMAKIPSDKANNSDKSKSDGTTSDGTNDDATSEDNQKCSDEQLEGRDNSKVVVCKVPPGNALAKHEICISQNAVDAQLATGSYVGKCKS
jgi:hypothetical protein